MSGPEEPWEPAFAQDLEESAARLRAQIRAATAQFPKLVYSSPSPSTPAEKRRFPPHVWERQRKRAREWRVRRVRGASGTFPGGSGGRSA